MLVFAKNAQLMRHTAQISLGNLIGVTRAIIP